MSSGLWGRVHRIRADHDVDVTRTPVGIDVAIGSLVVVVAGAVCAAVPASAPGVRLGLYAAALAGFAALAVALVATALVTAIGFAVFNGFLVNRLGELSWHGAADARRLAVLTVAALGGYGVGALYRLVRRGRLWRMREQQAATWARWVDQDSVFETKEWRDG